MWLNEKEMRRIQKREKRREKSKWFLPWEFQHWHLVCHTLIPQSLSMWKDQDTKRKKKRENKGDENDRRGEIRTRREQAHIRSSNCMNALRDCGDLGEENKKKKEKKKKKCKYLRSAFGQPSFEKKINKFLCVVCGYPFLSSIGLTSVGIRKQKH